MSKTISLLLLLLIGAAIPVTVHSNEKKSNDHTSLIANTTNKDISQSVSTYYLQIIELTPIPTDTPTPLPIITKTPQITPTAKKVVSTPTATPKPVSTLDFNWKVTDKGRTAVDFDEADIAYVKKRICEVFISNCNEALTIALHESRYRTNAASSGYFSTTNLGVFQINCKSHKKKVNNDCLQLLDLETNLRIARQIYEAQGWSPWSTKIYL